MDNAGQPRVSGIDARERLLTFAFAASDLLVEADTEQLVTFAAGAFQSRLGRPAEDFIGSPVSRIVAAEDQAALATALAFLAEHGRLSPIGIRIADAQRTAFALAGLASHGGTRFCLTFGRLPAPLPTAATAVSDHAGLLRVAEPRLREAMEGGPPARLALVQVDGLAEATVMLGHGARAELLDTIGTTISAAAPGGAVGELGGGRWGLVHGGGLDPASLAQEIERLARARTPASAAMTVAATDMPLDTTGQDAAQAVRALRLIISRFAEGGQMAIARAIGREGSGGLRRYLESLSKEASQVERAIALRRFSLAYQPVVGLDDRRVKHFEALIRPMPGPEGNMPDPQSFVTLAEAAGLAQNLDLAVLHAAGDALSATATPQVAVNISALSLSDPNFAPRCLAALDVAGNTPNRLLIEVTETADIEDTDAAAALIEELRRRGHAVCLDDFGAGAAGIRHLKRFPVDFVKIDGQYVRGAGRGGRDRALLAQIIQLCRSTGAQVIAEQVETEADAAMLRDLGVEYGQGFLFGRPGLLPGLKEAASESAASQRVWSS